MGTIRFARRANMTSFGMFVEDFVQRAEHCLAREVRSAAIRRPRAWLDGEWVAVEDMTRGHLSRWLEDPSASIRFARGMDRLPWALRTSRNPR